MLRYSHALRCWSFAFLLVLCASAGAQPKYPPKDKAKAAPAEPAKKSVEELNKEKFAKRWSSPQSLRTLEFQSKKSGKPILLYFCGSDWDDFTKEIDDWCIETEYFHNWAKDKVILVKVDFQAKGDQSKLLKKANEDLKQRFQVTRVPTFVFMDPEGNVMGRAGYPQAKLRKGEKKGIPYAWIEHAQAIVDGKAPPEELEQIEGIPDGIAAAKEAGLPLLMVFHHPKSVPNTEAVNKLLATSPFVKFVNTVCVLTRVHWKDDEDKSPEAEAQRKWCKDHKIGESPILLVLYDPNDDEIKARLTSFNVVDPKPTIGALERALPKIDYKGEWISNVRKARAIAAQGRRTMVIAFTGLTWCPHCQKLESEIFNQQSFKDFARYNLVLVRMDFPKSAEKTDKPKNTTEPPAEGEKPAATPVDKAEKEREELADMYNVKGFPTMVVLNAAGQKIATSGYTKGGPDIFLSQLKAVRDKDLAKHDHPSQW